MPKCDLVTPTLPGVPLTLEEIESIVRSEGGLDVVTYNMRGKFEHFVSMGISHIVFVSGRTMGHMQQMSDHVVKATTHRLQRPGPGMAPN